jgi:hypothetical protein
VEETINHLLISCVFAQQFWFHLLRKVRLHDLSPQPNESSFDEWWAKVERGVFDLARKGLNSMIILGAWMI